jgi:DNA-directed RNA polymerase delta subunit
MATKYIPATKYEIQLYRRNKAIKENNRQEITDNSLIALRKVHLSQQKKTEKFQKIAAKFNTVAKQQSHKRMLEIINYYLADIN